MDKITRDFKKIYKLWIASGIKFARFNLSSEARKQIENLVGDNPTSTPIKIPAHLAQYIEAIKIYSLHVRLSKEIINNWEKTKQFISEFENHTEEEFVEFYNKESRKNERSRMEGNKSVG